MLYEEGERYPAVEPKHLFLYKDVRTQVIEHENENVQTQVIQYENALPEIQAEEVNNEDNNSTCYVM